MTCTSPNFFHLFSFRLLGNSHTSYLSVPYRMIVARQVTHGCFESRSPIKGVLVFGDGVKGISYRMAKVVGRVPSGSRVRCGFLLSCTALPG